MVLSIQEAFNILDLRKGASADDIVNGYKRLALEWHPDRHNQSDLSFEKFSKINNAFRRLTIADDKEVTKPLAKEKMFQIFEDVYIKKTNLTANIIKVSISSTGTKNKKKEDSIVAQLSNEKKPTPLPIKVLDEKEVASSEDEDAEKNEEDSAAAEEERRKSAEKRRAKKKRRKEAKKLEKELLNSQADQALISAPHFKDSSCHSSRSSSIDTDSGEKINSSKKGGFDDKSHSHKTDSNLRSSQNTSKSAEEVKIEIPVVDPLIAQSRRLATRGNELASDENFIAAVELYSEAIRINSSDFRFFGNRSYCNDKLGRYTKALEDAERAIQLNPEWSKNYHRKGRALAGLKKYTEAEALFETVLKMDKDCSEAKQELYKVRLQQLMEMGFTKLQAETAILQHKSVSAALDALLQAPVTSNWVECTSPRKRTQEKHAPCEVQFGAGAIVPSSNDVYFSDDESQVIPHEQQLLQKSQQLPQKLPILQQKTLPQQPIIDIKLDPSNPEGLNSLWVGNISKDVEESALKRLFTSFGTIVSVKKKPDTYYAFVEFADKASCGLAMRALQGVLYGTQKLYIRFPGKTGTSSHPNNNPLILRKYTSTPPPTNTNAPITLPTTPWSGASLLGPSPPLIKMKGPVNGNECYFWRTTGCSYGDNCKFTHIQANKGIDRKPWQTVTV